MGVMKAIMVTVGNPSWLAERERRRFAGSLGGRWQANGGEAVRGGERRAACAERDAGTNLAGGTTSEDGAGATAARPFPGGRQQSDFSKIWFGDQITTLSYRNSPECAGMNPLTVCSRYYVCCKSFLVLSVCLQSPECFREFRCRFS
jgi:hypothetical protein